MPALQFHTMHCTARSLSWDCVFPPGTVPFKLRHWESETQCNYYFMAENLTLRSEIRPGVYPNIIILCILKIGSFINIQTVKWQWVMTHDSRRDGGSAKTYRQFRVGDASSVPGHMWPDSFRYFGNLGQDTDLM